MRNISNALPAWRKGLYLSLILSIISVFVIFFLTLDDDTLESVGRVRSRYLLIAIGLLFILTTIEGLRIKFISRLAGGGNIPLFQAIRVFLFSFFFAQVTPLAVGEWPAYIYSLNQQGLTLGQSSAVIAVRSFLTKLVFTFFAGILLVIYRGRLTGNFINNIFQYAFLISLLSTVIFLLILFKPHFLEWLAEKVTRIGFFNHYFWNTRRGRKLFRHFLREMHRFRNSAHSLNRYQVPAISFLFLLTIFYWLCYFSIAPILLMGLNISTSFFQTLIWQLIIFMVIAYLPLPGGSGAVEFGLATLFNVFVPSSLLGVFVIVWRLYTFYAILFCGGLLALGQMRQLARSG